MTGVGSMLKDVLRRMREGSTDIDSIARDLDIGRGTLDAILEMGIREGYLEKTSAAPSCGGCFLRDKCGMGFHGRERTEMYVLTPKGEEYAGL